ncbi:MAG: 50S ribosomal protein L1, partial [Candidatus Binatia bacterium]
MADKKAKEDIIEKTTEAQDAVAVETEVTVTAKGPEGEATATAKAGKRSEKSLKAAEEKAEKEARKAAGDTTPHGEIESAEKKGPKPKARSLLERRGKKYRKLAEQLEAGKAYTLKEALELAARTNPSKFDASVELHIVLGVDPRQADQNVRSTVSLPHGTGKTVRVAVFAPAGQHKAAKDAGADIALEDEFLQQLDK